MDVDHSWLQKALILELALLDGDVKGNNAPEIDLDEFLSVISSVKMEAPGAESETLL
jgi:hypothetical protein